MNRNMLCWQVALVLIVATGIGASSPQDLLPGTESAAQFQVNLDQVTQSGGCLVQLSSPCPAWEDPTNQNVLCDCTGPNDDSCSPEEAEGDDEDAAVYHAGYPLFPYSGFGYGSSSEFSTVCTTFYTCQPGCLASLEILDSYACNVEEVSASMEEGSRVNTEDSIWCDTSVALQTRESRMQENLANVSGIGLHLFLAE